MDEYVLKDADYPAVPEKEGYRGSWRKYTEPVTTDITITARYEVQIPVPTIPPDYEIMSPGGEESGASAGTMSGSSGQITSTVTEHHSYVYASGRLLRETITTTVDNGTPTTVILDFAYDAQGTPYSMTYTKGSAAAQTYYYITNLQGDVMYLVSANGTKVATYSYDPYGKVTSATGAMAEINPLRYRGYYYDAETAFNYLQSRYYDSAICRFINVDKYASTGQSFIGYNMFAYCNNAPSLFSDPTGTWAGGPAYKLENDGGSAGFGGSGVAWGAAGLGIGVLISNMWNNVKSAVDEGLDELRKTADRALYATKSFAQSIAEELDFKLAVHHIVPQGDYRMEEAREILNKVGISPTSSAWNLIIIPASCHTGLHTGAYMNYVTSRLRGQRGNLFGILVTLYDLRMEIAYYSATGFKPW